MEERDPDMIALDIADEYNIDITGFGDIYEVVSVMRLVKRLRKEYGTGRVYLASNKGHSGRGLSLSELEGSLKGEESLVADKGYVDSPPWLSKPRPAGSKNALIHSRFLVELSKVIFRIMLPVEKILQGSKRSHMVYFFTKARR